MAAKDNLGINQFHFLVSPTRRVDPNTLTDLADVDDPEVANDLIAYATPHTFGELHDVRINNLQATHAIERERARDLMKSIKEKGFDRDNPIEVVGDAEGGFILNGHHRAIAARAAGMRHIPAVVYNWGDMSRQIDVEKEYRYQD